MPGRHITDLISLERLQTVQDRFTIATGLAAILVDYRGKPVTSASGFTDFCSTMRQSAEGREGCYNCDAHGGLQAAIRRAPHIYMCHTGLVDFSIPLMIEDEYLGAMMCGQVQLPHEETHSLPTLAVHGPPSLSPQLKELRLRVPVMPMGRIRAAVDTLNELMTNLVNSAHLSESAPESQEPPTPIRAEVTASAPPRPQPVHTTPPPARRLDAVALRRAFSDNDMPRAVALVRQQLDGLFSPSGNATPRIGRELLLTSAQDILAIAEELSRAAASEISHRINQSRARARPQVTRYEADEYLVGLLFCLHSALERNSGQRSMQDLVNRIEHNPTSLLTLNEASEFVHLSTHHVSRLFKAHTGSSFNDFVNNRRMARAQFLLEYTDQPVVRIAADLCFRPANYFSRTFKAATGLTPSEYRRGRREMTCVDAVEGRSAKRTMEEIA